MIKSISFDQDEILGSIIELYCPDGFEVDPTYSKGNFYKKIKQPKYKFDIEPIAGVTKASADALPLEDESVSSIMFDPPFLATTGKSLKTDKGNIINRRFSVFPNEEMLHKFYYDSMKEFYRVLKDKGVLVFKCQDKVSSGKQYFSHVLVMNYAFELGFYPKDLFILMAKNRIVAEWQTKRIQHARKFHSYFWVFQKVKQKVDYNTLGRKS